MKGSMLVGDEGPEGADGVHTLRTLADRMSE